MTDESANPMREAIQSAMRLEDPFALELDYTRCMMAFLLFHPEPRRALMIGLGGDPNKIEHDGYYEDTYVKTPAGFKDAYEQYCANGWNGLTKNPEYGGQGLPQLVATAVEEMWHASNLAFNLCAMLTQGAIESIELAGSAELKQKFLPQMVAGTWTGTMNLTEPQAGSDLAAVRTRAVPQGDGTYKVSGQKIFITFGEHDLCDNIIHLVLARTPDAPPGTKGISCFIVPKWLVGPDGATGERNRVSCLSIEDKLGTHPAVEACCVTGANLGQPLGLLMLSLEATAKAKDPAGRIAAMKKYQKTATENVYEAGLTVYPGALIINKRFSNVAPGAPIFMYNWAEDNIIRERVFVATDKQSKNELFPDSLPGKPGSAPGEGLVK